MTRGGMSSSGSGNGQDPVSCEPGIMNLGVPYVRKIPWLAEQLSPRQEERCTLYQLRSLPANAVPCTKSRRCLLWCVIPPVQSIPHSSIFYKRLPRPGYYHVMLPNENL